MRYQIDPRDDIDKSKLENQNFCNIRKGYWLGLSNQPETLIFESDDRQSVRNFANSQSCLIWCLTTNKYI